MTTLDPADFRRRLKHDYVHTKRLASPALGRVKAYVSGATARRGREATPEEAEAGRVTLYDVEYAFPIAITPTATTDRVTVRFDLLAGGDYPFTAPSANVITPPRPYSHHFAQDSGWVCIGSGWEEAAGKYLFAQLVVHVMRLLNFDEPTPQDLHLYRSFNPEAATWWLSALHGLPFNPELQYPAIPSELTHGVEAPRVAVFRAIREAPAFRRVGASPGAHLPATAPPRPFRAVRAGRS